MTYPFSEPTDDELRRFLQAGADRYVVPHRISLRHIFVRRDQNGDQAAATAGRLRESLSSGANPDDLGDPFLRGREFRLRSRSELASIFGGDFARSVMDLPQGEWSEPVSSSFGAHLVYVEERQPERLPPMEEVRDRVLRDWRRQRREEANLRARKKLRARYDVRLPAKVP